MRDAYAAWRCDYCGKLAPVPSIAKECCGKE